MVNSKKFSTQEKVSLIILFKKEIFLIADEAHKLDLLLYDNFSPKLTEMDLNKIDELNNYFLKLEMNVNNKNNVQYYYDELMVKTNDISHDIELIKGFVRYLSTLNGIDEFEQYLLSNITKLEENKKY